MLFNWQCIYLVWLLEYLIKKLPISMKQATHLISSRIMQCIVTLLLVCILAI